MTTSPAIVHTRTPTPRVFRTEHFAASCESPQCAQVYWLNQSKAMNTTVTTQQTFQMDNGSISTEVSFSQFVSKCSEALPQTVSASSRPRLERQIFPAQQPENGVDSTEPPPPPPIRSPAASRSINFQAAAVDRSPFAAQFLQLSSPSTSSEPSSKTIDVNLLTKECSSMNSTFESKDFGEGQMLSSLNTQAIVANKGHQASENVVDDLLHLLHNLAKQGPSQGHEGKREGQELTTECVGATPSRSLAHRHCTFTHFLSKENLTQNAFSIQKQMETAAERRFGIKHMDSELQQVGREIALDKQTALVNEQGIAGVSVDSCYRQFDSPWHAMMWRDGQGKLNNAKKHHFGLFSPTRQLLVKTRQNRLECDDTDTLQDFVQKKRSLVDEGFRTNSARYATCTEMHDRATSCSPTSFTFPSEIQTSWIGNPLRIVAEKGCNTSPQHPLPMPVSTMYEKNSAIVEVTDIASLDADRAGQSPRCKDILRATGNMDSNVRISTSTSPVISLSPNGRTSTVVHESATPDLRLFEPCLPLKLTCFSGPREPSCSTRLTFSTTSAPSEVRSSQTSDDWYGNMISVIPPKQNDLSDTHTSGAKEDDKAPHQLMQHSAWYTAPLLPEHVLGDVSLKFQQTPPKSPGRVNQQQQSSARMHGFEFQKPRQEQLDLQGRHQEKMTPPREQQQKKHISLGLRIHLLTPPASPEMSRYGEEENTGAEKRGPGSEKGGNEYREKENLGHQVEVVTSTLCLSTSCVKSLAKFQPIAPCHNSTPPERKKPLLGAPLKLSTIASPPPAEYLLSASSIKSKQQISPSESVYGKNQQTRNEFMSQEPSVFQYF